MSHSDTLITRSPSSMNNKDDTLNQKQYPEQPKHQSLSKKNPENAGFLPEPPRMVESTGLSRSYLESLMLKHLFQAGDMRGSEMVLRTCLSSIVVEDVMDRLLSQKLVDIKSSSGAGLGRSSMIFTLTSKGHDACAHAMERDRYAGPAPVPYDKWIASIKKQTIRGNGLRRSDIESHFSDLKIPDNVFDTIGPAMNSGKALFFYGPPGNGKTAICERMTACFGGDVFIPHAVLIDDFVIKIFDSSVHRKTEDEGISFDERWVKCRRPMVFVGGELTLTELDLSYSPDVRYYEAPLQMKACCGVLLIDDFGRQRVSPKDLLNRWIVPLESEVDYLTMHTGKKIQIPFDVFVVFSTNLDPAQLVDNAFLRRVRYKLAVTQPDRELYDAIFTSECKKRKIPYRPDVVEHLVETHYKSANRSFNACEPRDLLSQVVDLCAYRGLPPHLSHDIIDRVANNYFVRFDEPEQTSDTLATV